MLVFAQPSPEVQVARFEKYRAHQRQQAIFLEQFDITDAIFKENTAMAKKRQANLRLSGPMDFLNGTFSDKSISGGMFSLIMLSYPSILHILSLSLTFSFLLNV